MDFSFLLRCVVSLNRAEMEMRDMARMKSFVNIVKQQSVMMLQVFEKSDRARAKNPLASSCKASPETLQRINKLFDRLI